MSEQVLHGEHSFLSYYHISRRLPVREIWRERPRGKAAIRFLGKWRTRSGLACPLEEAEHLLSGSMQRRGPQKGESESLRTRVIIFPKIAEIPFERMCAYPSLLQLGWEFSLLLLPRSAGNNQIIGSMPSQLDPHFFLTCGQLPLSFFLKHKFDPII